MPNAAEAFRLISRYVDDTVRKAQYFKEFCDTLRVRVPATEPHIMTYSEELLAEGQARGLAKGRELGREEGLLKAIETAAELLGLPLDERRRERLTASNAAELDVMLVHLRTFRQWPPELQD